METKCDCHRLEVNLLPKLSAGDILHVRVGLDADQLNDGQGAWIPSDAELDHYRGIFESAVPPGVTVIMTHRGVEVTETEIDFFNRCFSENCSLKGQGHPDGWCCTCDADASIDRHYHCGNCGGKSGMFGHWMNGEFRCKSDA